MQPITRPPTLPEAFPHPSPQPGNRAISSLAVPGSFSFYLCSLCVPQYTWPGRQPLWASAAPLAAETKQQEYQGALPHQLPATRHAAREIDEREVPGLVTTPGVT